ncbi:hypothetical protein ILYODFUR_022259 [Ilyodon furcidens]|uniref:Uncharacterized protein n=1 Tax=Ilyodon furcidens TaxID=33524 RepID=A0ABV0SP87_9TELE
MYRGLRWWEDCSLQSCVQPLPPSAELSYQQQCSCRAIQRCWCRGCSSPHSGRSSSGLSSQSSIPQFPDEVEMVVSFPDQTGSVGTPGEIIGYVHTQVPEAGDHFHSC